MVVKYGSLALTFDATEKGIRH